MLTDPFGLDSASAQRDAEPEHAPDMTEGKPHLDAAMAGQAGHQNDSDRYASVPDPALRVQLAAERTALTTGTGIMVGAGVPAAVLFVACPATAGVTCAPGAVVRASALGRGADLIAEERAGSTRDRYRGDELAFLSVECSTAAHRQPRKAPCTRDW